MKRFALLTALAAVVCLAFLAAPASACGLSGASAVQCYPPVVPQIQLAPAVQCIAPQVQLAPDACLPTATQYAPSVQFAAQTYAPAVQFAAVQTYAAPSFAFAAQSYGYGANVQAFAAQTYGANVAVIGGRRARFSARGEGLRVEVGRRGLLGGRRASVRVNVGGRLGGGLFRRSRSGIRVNVR